MNTRLRAGLLHLYPPAWRARYGDELEALILASRQDGGPGWRATIDLTRAGARERLRAWGLSGDGPSAPRTRSALLLVLCSWSLMILGGAALQRLSEHWQAGTPASSRALPAAAFEVLVGAGALGCALVLTGILIALPSLLRFLRAGGWPALRRPVVSAAASTIPAGAGTLCLVAWAHGLGGAQRNGGDLAYSIAFLSWAGTMAMALLAWTSAAVACGRHISLSEKLTRAEACLAVAVAGTSVIVTGAACVWWAALAADAPWVLHGGIPGSAGSALAPAMLFAAAPMTLGSLIAVIAALRCASGLSRSAPA